MPGRVAFIMINILILSACTSFITPTHPPIQFTTLSPPAGELQFIHTPMQGEAPDMTHLSSTPSAPGLEGLIENAKKELAQRLSIPVTQITTVDARDVVWSNASLGCPQPGMAYAEVLTPGYLIQLNANEQEYEYHAGKGSAIFYCENPLPPVEGMPGNT